MSKFVKLTFENENGKHKLYLTEEQLLKMFEEGQTFTSTIIDAKNGLSYKHAEEIKKRLKISEPPKEEKE